MTGHLRIPDDYFKKNPNPIPIQDLIDQAVPLVNEAYTQSIKDHILQLTNRNFNLIFKIKQLDIKGNLKGDFSFYRQGKLEEMKLNVNIDRINKPYRQYVPQIEKALDNYYDGDPTDMNLDNLIEIYQFSGKKYSILKELAKKIEALEESETKESTINFISLRLGKSVSDSVLREINGIQNSNLDPEASYPFMPASQAYDIKNKRAYIYYNLTMRDEEGIKIIPALLTSDKRTIRLDQCLRGSPQHLLLIDGAFQLHEEVPTAIMNTETCSLKSKFARLFIDGEVTAESVKPRKIIQEMEEYFKKVFYTDDQNIYKVLAIFAYSTYFYQLFGVTPYLLLNAQKGSGKSLLASVLSKLCFCCRYTVGTSEAALFRTISSCGGTIILDEQENLTTRDKTADSLMASILKSGYARNTGNTLRTNLETHSVEEFSLFGPKIISCIYGIEDVVADRTIKIPIKKYPASVTGKMMNISVFESTFADDIESTTSRACISALMNFSEIYEKFISTELEMGSARNSQIMRPIITLAAMAGADYLESVMNFYKMHMEKEKDWVEQTSPEGYLKEAFSVLRQEAGKSESTWLDEHTLQNFIKNTYIGGFSVNTFVVKILLDQIDGQKNYPMAEVHKLIKRVCPDLEFGPRTSISIASNENWVKVMGNKIKVSVYTIKLGPSEGNNKVGPDLFD